jgi:tripartite-type tricarboxylate transporter receptor subunit TctC
LEPTAIAPVGVLRQGASSVEQKARSNAMRRAISVRSVVFFCAALAMALPVGRAGAEPYPVRPVRIVVPTSPGGGIDFLARLIGQRLADRLGQPFVVENRAGAGGSIATEHVAKAAPDGYTLELAFVGQLAMLPHVQKVAYNALNDFAGVSLLASSYHVLVVNPSVPARTAKELIALAKRRPGELNYASCDAWTPSHLVPELFKAATATDIVRIQYKGCGPATLGMLSGEAQVMFGSPTPVMPYVRANRLAALAVTSPARLPEAPEVPTLVEAGVSSIGDAQSWYALVAPAATPRDVIEGLHAEIVNIAAMPDYQASLAAQGLEPKSSTPDEFAAFLRRDYDKWGKVISPLEDSGALAR